MNIRFLFLSGSVLLFTGCQGDVKAFVDTYESSGSRTLTLLGHSETESLSGPAKITDGFSSDIVIVDEHLNCALPAQVDGGRATLKADTICTETVLYAGRSVPVTITIKTGTALLEGNVVTLNYEGTASTLFEGMQVMGALSGTATLTRTDR